MTSENLAQNGETWYTLASGAVSEVTVTNTVTVDGVECVTVANAARVGGVTTSRIRQLILAGAFPGARRVGPTWVLPLRDVQRWAHVGWLRHRRRKPEPPPPDAAQLALPVDPDGDTSSLQGPLE